MTDDDAMSDRPDRQAIYEATIAAVSATYYSHAEDGFEPDAELEPHFYMGMSAPARASPSASSRLSPARPA